MAHRVFWSGVVLLVVTFLQPGSVGQSLPRSQTEQQDDAPWKRSLTGADARKVEQLSQQLIQLYEAGRYVEAQVPAREILSLRTRVQGARHWQTLNEQRALETVERIAALPAAAQAELTEATRIEKGLAELKRQGRYDEGLRSARRIVAIRQRLLRDESTIVARAFNDQGIFAHNAGQFGEAERLFRAATAISQKLLGDEHPNTASGYTNLALALKEQDRYTEAESFLRRVLVIRLQVHGEDHPDTAVAYNNLATNLERQGLYDDAEPLLRNALARLLRVQGADELQIATAYNNLAFNLHQQGRYAEADPLYHEALKIKRRALGADHPETALVYNNLATTLDDQGNYADAEPLLRKTLAIYQQAQAFGDEHPRTVTSYSNLALTLSHQGKYREAEPFLRKALAIQVQRQGENRRSTATYCTNLASNLQAQGKHAEAEALLERALAIFRDLLGDDHPDTTIGYNNLAHYHTHRGNYDQAEPLFRKALEVLQRRLGEAHPHTATAYSNVAGNHYHQGKYAEAEAPYAKAVAIFHRVLGEGHPKTAWAYKNQIGNWWAQGKYRQAESVGAAAAKSFEAARRRISFEGLGRAGYAAENSPLRLLTVVAARNGNTAGAWQVLENYLARGLLDDLAARPRSVEERQREQALLGKLNRFDSQIAALLGTTEVTAAVQQKAEEVRKQRDTVQTDFAQLQADLAAKYGVAAGEVYDLARIQVQLRADAALLAWVDIQGQPKSADPSGEHWVCVVRHRGSPVWTKLPGSGSGATWAPADDQLALQAREAFSTLSQESQGQWQERVRQLYAQRLAPIERQLGAERGLPAVRHLIVLPSAQMAGIPVEILADRYTVSYAPSGTLFAWLQEKRSKAEHAERPSRAGSILAVGDPVFEGAPGSVSPPQPPEHGILIAMVSPDSNAAQGGMKAGDVLLRYADTKLDTVADLDSAIRAGMAAPSQAAPRGAAGIPVRVWREGEALDLVVRPGRLGVEINPKPVAEALRAQRELKALTRGPRREAFTPLPGTRTEVQAIARTFPKADLLLGSAASEQNVDRLATTGRLREFRFLHFATHGVLDERAALRSALILAQDQLPDPLEQVLAGKQAYDGRLTAEQMLRSWQLDADLVTLSACQTGLGKYSGGEGYLGFSQALFLAGARSLVLSLWKVDDTATALLMTRFYENLLGSRAGVAGPLPKAQALAEAKRWLRGLNADDVSRLLAGLPDQTRGTLRTRKPSPTPTPPKPFAHPYYWSSFILIGDPH
jgi:CHAT domain-containing protein/tetratricopeptide (TPR) repeat protein